jgi:phosphoribosylamine--glycine ligase
MTMRILVVGGGGREHAIANALSRSNNVILYAVMPRVNPGISRLAARVLVEKETAAAGIAEFAKREGIEYAVIGPEAPLEAGVVDRLENEGVGCMGPVLAAARLETDKGFCREMMERHGVGGCPKYRVFHHPRDATEFIRSAAKDLVIKPIGLTGGKGVRVMGEQTDLAGALSYVEQLGGHVVVEERLIGEEFTLQAFVDGTHLVPMPLVQDHKRAYEGDLGPNTGGMGSYSMPDHRLPFVTDRDTNKALRIMHDAVAAMGKLGYPYKGVLYGQFMNTRDGPMVIEFNARFGDPEAMNVLSLLDTDFAEIVQAVAEGELSSAKIRFQNKATVCKYVVPEGYPEAPLEGKHITFGDPGKATLYYANVVEKDGRLYTLSSRTLAFVGIGDTLEEAEQIAESAASSVEGSVHHRRDIGTRALLEKRCAHMKELR